MCKPSRQPEYMKFVRHPFSSGVATPANRTTRKFDIKTCAFCGAVSITAENANRWKRTFCDHQCRSEFKKFYYLSNDYQNKSGIAVARERKAMKLSETKEQSRKDSFRCCSWCFTAVEMRSYAKFCSGSKCVKERYAFRSKLNYVAKVGVIDCEECGKKQTVNRFSARRKFCSSKCQSKHIKRNREHRKRTNGYSERIGTIMLAKNHSWTCAKCGVRCKRADGSNSPSEATLDHVHPLSKGGLHVWSNVQLLCRACNSEKSDKIEVGTQLMLHLPPPVG